MKFFLDNNQIRPLYHATGNNGCIASNRITVDGQKIGYMYREEPDKTFPVDGDFSPEMNRRNIPIIRIIFIYLI